MPATHLSSLRKNQRTCFGEWVKGNLLLRKREQGGFDFTPLSPDFLGGKESTFFFLPEMFFKGCVSGEDDGGCWEWGGGKLGDLLSEWERRRPDTRERKEEPHPCGPPAPTPELGGGEVGHKGCARPPTQIPGHSGSHRDHPPPPTPEQPHKTPPQPRARRGWERGRVTTRVPESLIRTRP